MEKRYVEVEKVKEEIINHYYHAMFIISETLVDESKRHISSEDAIKKIRNTLRNMPSRISSRMGIEDVLEKISVTEEEIMQFGTSSIAKDELEKCESYLNKFKNDCEKLNENLLDDSDVFLSQDSFNNDSYLDKLEDDCKKLNKDLEDGLF